jgi:hypothetical protein
MLANTTDRYFSHFIAGVCTGLICCTAFYCSLLPFIHHGLNGYYTSNESAPTYVVIANRWLIPTDYAILLGFCITPLVTAYALLRARDNPIETLNLEWLMTLLVVLVPFAGMACLFILTLLIMWLV